MLLMIIFLKKYILFWQNKMLVISYQTNVILVLFTSVPWTGAKGTEDDIWLRLPELGPCVWAPAHPVWGDILRWCEHICLEAMWRRTLNTPPENAAPHWVGRCPDTRAKFR